MILLGGCSCSVVQALIWLSWVRSPVGCFDDDVIQLPLRERVEVVDASYVLGVGPIHVVIARAVSGLITVARNISVSASRGVLTRNIAVHLPWRWMRASRLMVLVLRPLVLAVELPCWGSVCVCGGVTCVTVAVQVHGSAVGMYWSAFSGFLLLNSSHFLMNVGQLLLQLA